MLFILSLPRAGSTLLQRLLMGHPDIASCGEPWLGLPLVKLSDPDASFSTFGHASVVRSLEHLFELLPQGRSDYLKACKSMMLEIYEKILAEEEAEYFLDKTPRYYQIIPELAEMFPDAKFIFLTRDIVSVYASILNYIGGDTKFLPTWKQDIVEGIPALAKGYELLGARAYHVDYADMVADPKRILREMLTYLDLPWKEGLENQLSSTAIPRGDPTGTKKYSNISKQSLESWRMTIDSSAKKNEGIKWLSLLRVEDAKVLGIDLDTQLNELRELRVSFRSKDAFRLRLGKAYFNLQLNVVRWGFSRRNIKRSCTVY